MAGALRGMTKFDIIKLIEVCSKSNVRVLEDGKFKVEFFTPHVSHTGNLGVSSLNAPLGEISIPENTSQIEEAALEEETLLKRELEITEMNVLDPLRYEELVAQGELIDAKTEEDIGVESSIH